MSEEKIINIAGISFLGELFLVLSVLKYTGDIDTSGVRVFAPLWGPLGLVLALSTVLVLAAGILEVVRFCWTPRS